MGLGPENPLPMRVGGGPSPTWKAYQTIRQAVGEGGSAENDRGIDGLWRRSRAKGLAAATSAKRRALLQAFPQLATDAIPYYERLCKIIPPLDATETQRRDAVVERYTRQPIRSHNELLAALQDIDPAFTIAAHNDAKEIVAFFGRAFDGHDPSSPAVQPQFGIPGGCTQYPAFSTRQTVRVSYPITGAPTAEQKVRMDRARALLREALPTDVDFTIACDIWRLGTTPLGIGAFP
jgi:hypothetical protein